MGSLWLFRRTVVAVAVVALPVLTAACGVAAPPPTVSSDAVSGTTSPSGALFERPTWQLGDRWTYEWTSGNDSGTKAAEVVETREVSGVRYYVLRLGDVDQYYTVDLHWAAAVRDGKVAVRMSPPQPWFVWPLAAGRRWSHEGTWEDAEGKRASRDMFSVVGPETVNVPAGRFSAIKIMRDASSRVTDEYWYVPAVRFYVRWIGRRNDISFEERLTEYRPAGRPTIGQPPPTEPRPPSR